MPLRDAEGFLTGAAVFPLALSVAVGILVIGFAKSWRASASWLALAMISQAASHQLVNAGNRIGYQHYVAPQDLLSGTRALFALILAGQLLLVSAAFVRSRAAFPRGRMLIALAVACALSATFSKALDAYVSELLLASVIQIVALGNVFLVAVSVPPGSLETVRRWSSRALGPAAPGPEPGGADKFALMLAAFVTTVAAVLSVVSYGRHPHVPDEVVYLINAAYFADGKLFLIPPPVPQAFDVDLMHMTPDKWYVPVPPGWPAVLAIGFRLGAPWLVNPVLAGGCVLLAYAFARELYSRRTARLSVLLLSSSPWFLFMGMNFMTHLLTLALALTAALGVARAVRSGAIVWASAAGLSLGAMSLVRPLEALVVALTLGLWMLASTRGTRRASHVFTLIVSCAALASLALPYNRVFTGSPTEFPMASYVADRYGPGANDLGFGANRGLPWPGLDPFPGHGLPDVIVNAGLNLFSVNIELFGWATGSVLLMTAFVLAGRLTRADWMLIVGAVSVVAIHSLYWFSGGPDFGARYWFLIIVPCVVLSARAIEWLGRRGGTDRDRSPEDPRFLVAVGALTVMALATFIPWRAVDKYHHYRVMRPGVEELAREAGFGRSLVLVRGARHPDFASAFPYGALLRGGEGPVYAWERTPAVGDSARAAFPDRPVWVINGPTVTKRGFEVAERPTSSAGDTNPRFR